MRTSQLATILAGALMVASGFPPGLPTAALGSEDPAPLPPAPESRIHDPGRVFTFDQATHDELSARLREVRAIHGLDIHVAAYSFLLGESIESRAKRLAAHWLTEPRGLVIVYERGGGKVTFAASEHFVDFLPALELEEIFSVAAMSAKQFDDPALRLKAACEQLIDSVLERLETREEQRSFLRRDIVLLAAGVLVVLALLARFAFALLRIDRRAGTARYFPAVDVQGRFGAPHGGGVLAEVSFASPPPDSSSGSANPRP